MNSLLRKKDELTDRANDAIDNHGQRRATLQRLGPKRHTPAIEQAQTPNYK